LPFEKAGTAGDPAALFFLKRKKEEGKKEKEKSA